MSNPFDFGETPSSGRPDASRPPRPASGPESPFDFGAPPRPGTGSSRQPLPPPRPPRAPNDRRRRWTVVGVAALVVVLVAAGLVVWFVQAPGGRPTAAPPTSEVATPPLAGDVSYEVHGSGTASSIVFSAGDGAGESRVIDQPLPFRRTVAGAAEPALFTVVATNGSTSATLTCTVTRAGHVVDERSATGPGAVVTCSGA